MTILSGQSSTQQQLQFTSPRVTGLGFAAKPFSAPCCLGSGSRLAEGVEFGVWKVRCSSEGHQPRLQGTSQHGLQLCLLPQFHSLFALTLVSTKTRCRAQRYLPSLALHSPSPLGSPSSALELPMPFSLSKPFSPVARAEHGCQTAWESYWWPKSQSQSRAHSGSTWATGISTYNGAEGTLVSSTARLSLSVVCS